MAAVFQLEKSIVLAGASQGARHGTTLIGRYYAIIVSGGNQDWNVDVIGAQFRGKFSEHFAVAAIITDMRRTQFGAAADIAKLRSDQTSEIANAV